MASMKIGKKIGGRLALLNSIFERNQISMCYAVSHELLMLRLLKVWGSTGYLLLLQIFSGVI